MMKTLKTNLLLLSVLVGLIGCTLQNVELFSTPSSVALIVHVPTVQDGIKTIWTQGNVYVLWNGHDITLDALAGNLCFLGDLEKRDLYEKLICLESPSGRFLWSRESGAHSTLAVTSGGIFVAYNSGAYLNKFNVESGDLIWKKPLRGTGSVYLYYLNDQIQVSTTNPEKLWILDSKGDIINTIKYGEHTVFFSATDETYTNLNGLEAIKVNTDQVLWAYVDTQHLTQAPVFNTDEFYLRNGTNFSGIAYALDRHNGKLLWNISNIIGNLVYSPDKQLVYALRENGDLLAIDAKTGNENILATFSPAPFLFFDGVDTCAYQLAYDSEKHILVVYLGDSRQLFAFKVE